MRATIDSEGRIEIPEALREELGLVPGDEVELRRRGNLVYFEASEAKAHLEWDDGWLVSVAANDETLPVEAVEEIIRELREPPLSKYGYPDEDE